MKNVKVYYFAVAIAAVAIAAVAVLISGCQKRDPAAIVKQRAAERWNLLVEHHAVKAYDYLSPGYRETHSLEQYVAFISTVRIKWRSAKVLDQQCDTELCTVHLMVMSGIPGQLAGVTRDIESETPVTEHWVASAGQWYFLPEAPTSLSNHATVTNETVQGAQDPSSASSPSVPVPAVPPAGQPGSAQPPTRNDADK